MRLPRLKPSSLTSRSLWAAGGALLTLGAALVLLHRLDGIVAAKGRDLISRAARKAGVPVEVGAISVSLKGVVLEDIRVGARPMVVVSRAVVAPDLNPFSPGFLGVDTVFLEKANLKVTDPERLLEDSVAAAEPPARRPAAGPEAGGAGANPRAARLERLFRSLPVNRLRIGSGTVTVLDHAGGPLVTATGLRLSIHKQSRRILATIERLEPAGAPAETGLQFRFELNPRGPDYRFSVRRAAADTPARSDWAARGFLSKDLTRFDAVAALARPPGILGVRIARALGDKTRLKLKGRLAARLEGDAWRFDARLESTGSVLEMPVLAQRPIGPVRLTASVQGRASPAKGLLAVESGVLELPPRRTSAATGAQAAGPLKALFSGAVRVQPPAAGRPAAIAVQGEARVPATACQTLLDAAPEGFLPLLGGFEVTGRAGIGLAVRYDSADPENTVSEIFDGHWACRVKKAPPEMTAARLTGAFTLSRAATRENAPPVELVLDPAASGFTPLARIGRIVNQAFVAAEDAGFYHHKGIDIGALQGALRRNLTDRKVSIGGSTITMQLVKNMFLGQERTISRKTQELFLAWYLETILSKERILEIYLNVIEFGPGIYGITNAAAHFFGKHPLDLNMLESAYLASLLPAPQSRYRYFCDGALAPSFMAQVHGVLRRLLALGRIDGAHYLQAIGEVLQFDENQREAAPVCREMPPKNWGEEAAGVEP